MKKTNYVKAVAFLIGASMSVTLLNGCNKKDKTETTEGIVETEGSSESSAETESTTETEITEAISTEIPEGADLDKIKSIFAQSDGAMYILNLQDASYDPSAELNKKDEYPVSLYKKEVSSDSSKYVWTYYYSDGNLIKEEGSYFTTEYFYAGDLLIKSKESYPNGDISEAAKYAYDDEGRIIEAKESMYDDGLPRKIYEYTYEGDYLIKEVYTLCGWKDGEQIIDTVTTTEFSYGEDGSLKEKKAKTYYADIERCSELNRFDKILDKSEYYYEDGLLVKEVEHTLGYAGSASYDYDENDLGSFNEFVSTYDESGNLIKYEQDFPSTPLYMPTHKCWEYTYDDNGLVTHISYYSVTKGGTEETCEGDYEYEFGGYLKRSLSMVETDEFGTRDVYVEYVFDEDGNILSTKNHDTSENYDYSFDYIYLIDTTYEYVFDDEGRIICCIEKESYSYLSSVYSVTTTKYFYD